MNAHEKLIASVQAEVQSYEREAAQAKLQAHATDLLVLLLQDLRERGGDFRLPTEWWPAPQVGTQAGALWEVGRTSLGVIICPGRRRGFAFVGELRVGSADLVRFETSCAAVLADWILLRLREAEKRCCP